MKTSEQIAILAAVGIGAYLLLRTNSAGAGTVRYGTGMTTGYPTGTQPQAGTPAYAQWLAQQQQNQIDLQKLNLLNSAGKMINGWFSNGPGPGAGNLSGNVRPSTDYGMNTYTPPDMSATNTPYVADVYQSGIPLGSDVFTSSDRAALYGNEGYGFYTQ